MVFHADQPASATIVSKSFLSLARVLAASFHEYHPSIPFFVLLADEVDGFFDPDAERFRLLGPDDLGSSAFGRMRFHYRQQPFSYALTPYLLAHLLDRGYSRVIFFK